MTPETPDRLVRRLSRSVEAIHTLSYYTPEITRLSDEGYRGWWHAYFAYRAAPLGPVPAAVVTATFYNFAPRMVERAVPGVWQIMAPNQILARRQELVAEAIDRIWADGRLDAVLEESVDLATEAIEGLEDEARPLAAAHRAIAPPAGPAALRLWHACTVWREYRGDGHNIALAAAGVGGLESHLLMAAHGRGNQATITGIRGWTAEEWDEALDGLRARGILSEDGSYTDRGRQFRSDIEAATDELCATPLSALGIDRATRLEELLQAVTADLLESGAVPGVWPPPTVLKD